MNFSQRAWGAALTLTALLLPAFAAEPSWVAKSNTNALLLLQTRAKYSPEDASQLGLEDYDEKISDLSHDLFEAKAADTRTAIDELKKRLATENDPGVKQDLEILIAAGEDEPRSTALTRKYFIPFIRPTSVGTIAS
jgi:hypothetical protein